MAFPQLATDTLQSRIARMKSRQLVVTPKKVPEPGVKVHRCFSQVYGSKKPKYCSCNESIPYHEALQMVVRRNADWLLVPNPKSVQLTKFYRAIVICQPFSAVKQHKEERKEGFRAGKFFKIESDILAKFRTWAEQQFSKGSIPQALLNMNESELSEALRDVEKLRERFPELGEKKVWNKLVYFGSRWWNSFLNHEKLTENRGEFLTKSPKGKGQIVSGQYEIEKIDSYRHIQDATAADPIGPGERDSTSPNHGRRTAAANFRSGDGGLQINVNGKIRNEGGFWKTGTNPSVDGDRDQTADSEDTARGKDKERGTDVIKVRGEEIILNLDHNIDVRKVENLPLDNDPLGDNQEFTYRIENVARGRYRIFENERFMQEVTTKREAEKIVKSLQLEASEDLEYTQQEVKHERTSNCDNPELDPELDFSEEDPEEDDPDAE